MKRHSACISEEYVVVRCPEGCIGCPQDSQLRKRQLRVRIVGYGLAVAYMLAFWAVVLTQLIRG